MSLPSVDVIGAQIASQLRNIKIVAMCSQCQERWEAVVLEAPLAGLSIAKTMRLIPSKNSQDSLEFAQSYYQEMFDNGHPQHKMQVTAEFTTLAAFAPRLVPYVLA